MSRIAIVGPGSVGVYFGAHLAAAGHEVVACARRAFTDYRVDSPTDPVAGPATVVTDPSQLDGRPFDWVLVGVKAHQTAGAADWISATCGPGAVAVVLQNGVEGVERVQPFVTGATILNSVVYCGAELLTPGHINHLSAGFLWLPDCPDAHRLADLSARRTCNTFPACSASAPWIPPISPLRGSGTEGPCPTRNGGASPGRRPAFSAGGAPSAPSPEDGWG